jgi:hypothetical protein
MAVAVGVALVFDATLAADLAANFTADLEPASDINF